VALGSVLHVSSGRKNLYWYKTTGPRRKEVNITSITCTQYKFLSYRREIALQGGLVMAKSGRLELGDNTSGHYKSIFNHCDVFDQPSNRIR